MEAIKEEFIGSVEDVVKTVFEKLAEDLELDSKGKEELDCLIEKEYIAKEVYNNTYALYFDDDLLKELMETSVKLDKLLKRGLSESGISKVDFENISSKVLSNIVDDYKSEILKISSESLERL